MNYKEKTDQKSTTDLGFVYNNVSWQLHEKQSTLHFATNTTTKYSPNWCWGQGIYLQLDAVQSVALWLLENEVSFVIVMKYVSRSWWLPLTLLLNSEHRMYVNSGIYL